MAQVLKSSSDLVSYINCEKTNLLLVADAEAMLSEHNVVNLRHNQSCAGAASLEELGRNDPEGKLVPNWIIERLSGAKRALDASFELCKLAGGSI